MTFKNALRKLYSRFSTTPASPVPTARSTSATASPRISVISSLDELPPELAAALSQEIDTQTSCTDTDGGAYLEHYGTPSAPRDMTVNVFLSRGLPDDVLTVVADSHADEDDCITFYRGGSPRLKVPKCTIYLIRWTEWASPNRIETP